MKTYLISWALISSILFLAAVADRRTFFNLYKGYFEFLTLKWKILTFIVSGITLVGLVPVAHDRTWDYIDASFMSVLTFVTAPWAVSVLFRYFRRRTPFLHLLIAICILMFSSSWSYDLYNYLKDGYYPPSWFSNLLLSSLLYVAAGLFWNLTYDHHSGIRFAFTLDTWPNNSSSFPIKKLIIPALPFLIVYFYVVFGLFCKL